ncbi:hypothetical protein OSB04_015658 [Centaurea solstitialis]|uniref:Uncharacterized protein n=1 Tax=Centaurea solstitialis TaxID=347529 RepID=A0AA38T798_9ASTR|nr:hypothetical protein OSB04_015658 [Centaurea solstitialis]
MIIEDECDHNAPIEVAREVSPIEVETVMNDREVSLIANFNNFSLVIDKSKIKQYTSSFGMLLKLIQHISNQQNYRPNHGGSIPGRLFISRDRESANSRLFHDYFSETPLYNDAMFRRRFRMSRSLFLRIVDEVKSHDGYFVQRRDLVGRLGLSPLQKVTAVFRMLAYGQPADSTDEYVKIGQSTAIESMKRFCRAIVEIFSERYLRSPTANDVARLLYIGGKKDYDLWIWHAYFGMPGTNNDINVLESSHLFSNLAQGIAPPARYCWVFL